MIKPREIPQSLLKVTVRFIRSPVSSGLTRDSGTFPLQLQSAVIITEHEHRRRSPLQIAAAIQLIKESEDESASQSPHQRSNLCTLLPFVNTSESDVAPGVQSSRRSDSDILCSLFSGFGIMYKFRGPVRDFSLVENNVQYLYHQYEKLYSTFLLLIRKVDLLAATHLLLYSPPDQEV